jgi:hypothetical protein
LRLKSLVSRHPFSGTAQRAREPEGNTPTLASGHWQLGLALEKLGRKQDAIAEVKTAVKMEPQLKSAKSDLKRLQS